MSNNAKNNLCFHQSCQWINKKNCFHWFLVLEFVFHTWRRECPAMSKLHPTQLKWGEISTHHLSLTRNTQGVCGPQLTCTKSPDSAGSVSFHISYIWQHCFHVPDVWLFHPWHHTQKPKLKGWIGGKSFIMLQLHCYHIALLLTRYWKYVDTWHVFGTLESNLSLKRIILLETIMRKRRGHF